MYQMTNIKCWFHDFFCENGGGGGDGRSAALWQLLPVEVVTKRGFLAKNDARRRAVSKYDTRAMHPPKDRIPGCILHGVFLPNIYHGCGWR